MNLQSSLLKSKTCGKLNRLHLIIAHLPQDQIGLYNIKATEEQVLLSNYHLTESRLLFFHSEKNNILANIRYANNKYTESLRKLMIHLSTEKEPGNYIEAIDAKMLYNHGVWRILENEDGDYSEPLEQNEHIRLGRQIIRVAKIIGDKPSPNNPHDSRASTSLKYISYGQTTLDYPNVESFRKVESSRGQSFKNINVPLCRICLDCHSEANQFAPDLCKCKNMPVHLSCLRSWMSTKIQTTNFKNMSYYDITQLSCEVCKFNIPPIISVNNVDVFLVNINIKEAKNLVVLEVFELSRERIKGILVIYFTVGEKTEILFGRSDDCDILFKDVSISRNHAKMVWKNGKFYIFNIESKFGTVKRVVGKLDLADCRNQKFVIDKFLFTFHLMKGKKSCKCFKIMGTNFKTNPIDRNDLLQRHDSPEIKPAVLCTKPLNISLTDTQNQPLSNFEQKQSQKFEGGLTSDDISTRPSQVNTLIDSLQGPESNKNPAIGQHDVQEYETPINSKRNLIANEFERDQIKNSRKNNLTSSRRLIDMLNEQSKRNTYPIEEIDNSNDSGVENNTQSEIKKAQVRNTTIMSEFGYYDKTATESTRTISELYWGSFKNYRFN